MLQNYLYLKPTSCYNMTDTNQRDTEKIMQLRYEIPDTFWSLFRSVNREIYMESLLVINEEYQYSNYFLTKEICVQVLSDMNAQKQVLLQREENETDFDMLETTASRILRWLLKTGWLKKIEDYSTMTTNIVIPDYAAVFIEAFERLTSEELEETELYIQNVYATLFSFQNNSRVNLNMLRTALINTRKLNKALQDMLHNMDKFFERLLDQKSYGELLREHLDGYVEEIVKKKYHILKTSDNFYLYKTDIKHWIGEMRDDEQWLEALVRKSAVDSYGLLSAGRTAEEEQKAAETRMMEDILEKLSQIERGFDDIEHRISNMDKEHSRYVRATVTRLNYLLNQEDNTKGLIIRLLNRLADDGEQENMLTETGKRMNLSQMNILSEASLYKRRKVKADFSKNLEPDEEDKELTTEEILNLNRVKNRYSRSDIENFITQRAVSGKMEADADTVSCDEEFEKLILAYDYSTRQKSRYLVEEEEAEMIDNGRYRYPKLVFVRRNE